MRSGIEWRKWIEIYENPGVALPTSACQSEDPGNELNEHQKATISIVEGFHRAPHKKGEGISARMFH